MVPNLPTGRINCLVQQVPTVQMDFRRTPKQSGREMHQMRHLQTSLPNPSQRRLRKERRRRSQLTVHLLSALCRDVSSRGLPAIQGCRARKWSNLGTG